MATKAKMLYAAQTFARLSLSDIEALSTVYARYIIIATADILSFGSSVQYVPQVALAHIAPVIIPSMPRPTPT